MRQSRHAAALPAPVPSTTERSTQPALWARKALGGLARRARLYLARACAEARSDAAADDESMRFMNDVSGGGFRAREAARSLRRAQAPGSPAGAARPPDPAAWLFF